MRLAGMTYCSVCSARLVGTIEVERHVWLDRRCPAHGQIRTMLYHDPEYFEAAMQSSIARDAHSEKCLVLEVTDRCEVGCATCSASSTGNGAEPQRSELLSDAVNAINRFGDVTIALSGGEPLARRDLPQLLDELHTHTERIVLITSGHGLESNAGLVAELARRAEFLEIYLQFDSLRDRTLRKVRGPMVTSELRRQRLQMLASTGLRVTAICVVSDGLDEVAQLVETVRGLGANGITFQPLRLVGRFPSDAHSSAHLATVDTIQAEALRACATDASPTPHPAQPFDLSCAWIDESGICMTGSYFRRATTPLGFRVATYSYWDATNYFEPLARMGPHFFHTARGHGSSIPLNRRYFSPERSEQRVSLKGAKLRGVISTA